MAIAQTQIFMQTAPSASEDDGKDWTSRRNRIWVEDLISVCIDLLPNEVMLCKELLEALRSSGVTCAQYMGQDEAAEANGVVTKYIDSLQEESARRTQLLEAQTRLQMSAVAHDTDASCNVSATPSNRSGAETGEAKDMNEYQTTLNSNETDYTMLSTGKSRAKINVMSSAVELAADASPKPSNARMMCIPDASFGNYRRRLFLILEDTHGLCRTGKIYAWFMICVITVCTVSFVVASLPRFQHTPEECVTPLTVKACEPQTDDIFFYIDAVCIILFSIDYALRVGLVHSDVQDGISSTVRTLRYMKEPMNIIDVIAIAPFYVEICFPAAPTEYMRVLRLARILRPFKMAKHHEGIRMFAEVMHMSGQPLLVLLLFNIMVIVFFASLMYYAERGSFSVAPEFTNNSFPTGVYVRRDAQDYENEVSPFRSIPYSFWFVCVTMTTVGYGDYSPTTPIGKVIGVCSFYVGILFIAFPLGVLSSNFNIVYSKHHKAHGKSKAALRGSNIFHHHRTQGSESGIIHWIPHSESLRRSVFLVLHEPSISKVGKVFQVFMILVILLSVAVFIFETMPDFNRTPDECVVNLSVDNCKPQPAKILWYFETVCVIVFTVDYVVRIGLSHACVPEDIELISDTNRPLSRGELTWRYLAQPMNIIDFLAIAPFYIELIAGSATLEVVRIVRLARLFRLLKTPKMRLCFEMFTMVIVDATPALMTLLFATVLMCVLFAAFMVFAESSTWSVADSVVNAGYPTGAYMRPTADGHSEEMSPFLSIPYACWWFFVTTTTVGYGDDVPTTVVGRGIAICCFYLGIVLLALPLSIVGQSFQKFYPQWVQEFHRLDHENDSKHDKKSTVSPKVKSTRFEAWQ